MIRAESRQPFLILDSSDHSAGGGWPLRKLLFWICGVAVAIVIIVSIVLAVTLRGNGEEEDIRFQSLHLYPEGMIISGGYNEETVELYDIYNLSSCLLSELSSQRYTHTQNGVLTCGGGRMSSSRDSCTMLINGSWTTSEIDLQEKRWEHSSWQFDEGVLLIGGVQSPTTTEIVLNNGSTVMHYDLRNETRSACLINEGSSFLLTGGQGEKMSSTQIHGSTIVARYDRNGWLEDLPPLLEGRRFHGCSLFARDGDQLTAVVAGGYGFSEAEDHNIYLDTCEMFDFARRQWSVIASLPMALKGLVGVTIDNYPVMIGGTEVNGTMIGSLYRYQHTDDQWVMAGDMNVTRSEHAVSTIDRDTLQDLWQYCQ